jgi:hypothetical protein
MHGVLLKKDGKPLESSEGLLKIIVDAKSVNDDG